MTHREPKTPTLESVSDEVLVSDAAELRRLDASIAQRVGRGQPHDRLDERRARLLERSARVLQARAARTLQLQTPEALPIAEHRDEILQALAAHQVVVVAGETGSGKTTQLPKLLLEAGYGRRGLIGHTQPRRLAARNVAARLAEELGVELGGEVGFQTRFEQALGDATRVKLMTDGILLAETAHDAQLLRYDALIIDEAHERSLNIDFLLGYLHRLRSARPDLKVIITSATIDEARFAEHFGAAGQPAPVVNVSGRTYPVTHHYLPAEEWPEEDGLAAGVAHAVQQIAALEARGEGAGVSDVLVFLPGEREIRDVAHSLRGGLPWRDVDVLPLYARLSARDQQRVFQPGPARRIVLATNVAETSLTVPRIGYVIDTGLARISRYSFRSKLQRLPVEPISRASADQRAGRCGRLAPGVCVRLYGEADFEARDAFTEPEILRTNLAAVVLQMRVLGLGDPEDFPFLQAPDPRALSDGRRLLVELGALDAADQLTELGRTLARLPLDPRLGRMLVAAAELGCVREALIIVSALAVQDPRDRPAERAAAADAAHAEFVDHDSDFLTLLKLWQWVEQQRETLSSNAWRRACSKRFLSVNRLREWRALHRQLHLLGRELGWREVPEPAPAERIHQALVTGLLGFIGARIDKGGYVGARGSAFQIFPGSGLFKRQPAWVMAGEIVETSRVYARMVAGIDPAWLESAAAHLIKRSHDAPHWRRRAGRVMAVEKVTLYGLTLVDGRQVPFDPIDPVRARELFLLEGLAAGDIDTRGSFLAHNAGLLEEVRDMEARERRRDLLVGEEVLASLYAQRIPEHVMSARAFERWRRKAEAEQPRLLHFTLDEVLMARPDAALEDDYPGTLALAGLQLPLSYAFAPGADDDGVTVRVPRLALAQLRSEPLQWLVPGLLEAKITALLRGLPKRIRRELAPVPDRVRVLLPQLLDAGIYRRGSLLTALTTALQRQLNIDVPADAWSPQDLDVHLAMRIEVIDAGDQVIAQGRDLLALQRELAADADAHIASEGGSDFERVGLTEWDLGEVPEEVTLEAGVQAWPAFVDETTGVALRLQPAPELAAALSVGGVLRLLLLVQRKNVKHLQRRVDGLGELQLLYAAVGDPAQLVDHMLLLAAGDAHFGGGGMAWQPRVPRGPAEFDALLDAGRSRLAACLDAVVAQVRAVLEQRAALSRALESAAASPAFADALDDVRGQLQRLLPADWLLSIPRTRLADLPRYLAAMVWRLEHLQGAVDRDITRIAELAEWQSQLDALQQTLEADPVQGRVASTPLPVGDGAVARCRWMLEEYRVSLFAQHLGTREPVSGKRLRSALREAQDSVRLDG